MKNRAEVNLRNFWSGAGLFLLLLLSPFIGYATHLRAGEITVERVNCSSLTFRITITAYTNTGSEIEFGEGLLDFGDGRNITSPTIANTPRPDLGKDVGIVQYTTTHTYPGPGRYVISYLEPNRNGGILNIFNSVETRFYIETVINIDPFVGCNNSPKLLVPPIDKACTGAAWFHNPGAYDPDGDSISFQMTIPKKEKAQVVDNYRDPNNKEFYDKGNIPYGTANEDGDGPPTFDIDEVTGTLVWNAPGVNGEYNIAFLIKEWRKVNGKWVLIGYVVRDMQIIVEDCDNQRPELLVPEDICVEAGETITQDIFGFDPDSDDVKIEAFSQVFSILPSSAKVTQPAADKDGFQPSSPANHARLIFEWKTACEHIKQQPYQVVFKITDRPASGKRLIQFKTWNITVVGPAPKWDDAFTIPQTRSASLSWDLYKCQNATTMQVWRRVDEFPYTPPECVTGMPDFLGYTQIAEVPISQTKYTDNNKGKGLAVGAAYCYRLVAVFPLPGGGESYLSKDTCLAPIKATAPIITNVSVDKTANTEGAISLRWRTAYDLDQGQFPPPYSYDVHRAEGISGDIKLTKVHTGHLADTTYVDADPVLNTEGLMYNYRVVLFDGTNSAVDTSDVASTVRLEAKPQLKAIELVWAADVPWSNNTDQYPWHLIYRGAAGKKDGDLVLIDSVNVNKDGFKYVDAGQYQNTPLKETEIYCYRIMTRGAYGNPRIIEPLNNFSQTLCAQPNDNTPPCQPALEIVAQSCDEIASGCGNNLFSNTLTWPRPADIACRNDITSYNIYIADRVGDEFRLYRENVRDTFFIDTNENLRSYARCYKIQAVDRSGNKSDLSETFCFDNCPYYELPNVFTPDGDGCNPLFSAFSDRVVIDETTGKGPCGQTKDDIDEQKPRCARFVLAVKLKVYNRWGKEVYNYESGGERTIYIDWDGRDSEGSELAAGVYYYIAEVTYDVVDPAQATQFLKGWVHLVR